MLHKVEEVQEDLECKGQINSNSSGDETGKLVHTLKLLMTMIMTNKNVCEIK
jgi:hypothetical protein